MNKFEKLSEDEYLEAVKENGYNLRFVKEQTEAICLEAVKENGDALQYVKEQTEAICLEAVKQDGNALEYVKEQTEAICLEAVKQDGNALKYVENYYEEITKLKNCSMEEYIEYFKKDKIEEMTLEEVCKKLGKNIKIIK